MRIAFIISLFFSVTLSAQISTCDPSVALVRPDGLEAIQLPHGPALTNWNTIDAPYDYHSGVFVPASKLTVGRHYRARTFYHSRQCYSYTDTVLWQGGVDQTPTVANPLPSCGYRSRINKLNNEVYILSSWVDCGADVWPTHQWQRVYFRKWRNLPFQNREDILLADLKPRVWYRLRSRCGDCDVVSNYIRG